jgi:hypothetical protein
MLISLSFYYQELDKIQRSIIQVSKLSKQIRTLVGRPILEDDLEIKKTPGPVQRGFYPIFKNIAPGQPTFNEGEFITRKNALASTTDYGHTKAKSLILCGPNSNPNSK